MTLLTVEGTTGKLEYMVRKALFIARQYGQNLEEFYTLNIRCNMDGTLIGIKHVVAIYPSTISKVIMSVERKRSDFISPI